MSKMKELNMVATDIVDLVEDQIDYAIEWQVDGTEIEELEGDDYHSAIEHIRREVVRQLHK